MPKYLICEKTEDGFKEILTNIPINYIYSDNPIDLGLVYMPRPIVGQSEYLGAGKYVPKMEKVDDIFKLADENDLKTNYRKLSKKELINFINSLNQFAKEAHLTSRIIYRKNENILREVEEEGQNITVKF